MTSVSRSNRRQPTLPSFVPAIRPALSPVANQIRSYYKMLHSDYMTIQRHEALLKVQQSLEPITVALISRI